MRRIFFKLCNKIVCAERKFIMRDGEWWIIDLKARGGGGGYSPQILVGMCRGKVKNGQGLRNELPVERENVGAPERAWAVLSLKMRNGR